MNSSRFAKLPNNKDNVSHGIPAVFQDFSSEGLNLQNTITKFLQEIPSPIEVRQIRNTNMQCTSSKLRY